MEEYKNRENRLRRLAKKQYYEIKKSRANYSGDNLGGYQIINGFSNAIEAGEKFDLSLDDIEKFLNEDKAVSDFLAKENEKYWLILNKKNEFIKIEKIRRKNNVLC
jgi:hypothetical protein